jgi:pre-rRNA-processing protein RIX1
MAPIAVLSIDERQSSTLRAITFRLQATPLHQLPQISSHIAAQLLSCKQILAASQDAVSKENASLLHSFKTRLSSLLQDRTVEGRWSAVILLKSTIELGGSELLLNDKERCLGWIRALVGILGKPDPSSTKNMAIVTLTRIFILTREHQTLTRELTTPNLPFFVTACLNHFQGENFASKPSQRTLLEPVLESFTHLVPRHPTVFRSFLSKIRKLVLQILSRSAYDNDAEIANHTSKHLRDVAQRLLVQLHLSAQKSGSAEEWGASVRALVTTIHATADQIFRATLEDWESVCDVRSTLEAGQTLPDQPQQLDTDQAGLSGWVGIRAGSDRMTSLLALLTQYISTPGSASTPLRTGLIVDLLARLMYMRVPLDRATAANRANNQVGRPEREELWSALPSIHVASIEVFVALIQRMDSASSACNVQLLDLLPWLFESERSNVSLRTAVYKAIAVILTALGSSLSKASVLSLDPIIQSCCSDVLPSSAAKEIDSSKAHLQSGSKSGQQGSSNSAASILSTTTTVSSARPMDFPGLLDAAYHLLPVLLAKLPAQYIPVPARAELDRVAVLIKHPEALAASVLSPSPHKPSLLPLMATLCSPSLVAEGILRPRMPVIRTIISKDNAPEDLEEEEINGTALRRGAFEAAADELRNENTEKENIVPVKTITFTNAMEETLQQTFVETREAPIASSLIAPVSTKRSQEEQPSPLAPVKRARIEPALNASILPVPAVMTTETQSETTTTTVLVGGTDVGMIEAGADDDSDDGSDFEIPTLTMKGDEDDDEEEEEEEDDDEDEDE